MLSGGIAPSNAAETNEQSINQIYLQSLALQKPLSAAQIQTLYTVADQCPHIGGPAVYSARSICKGFVEHIDFQDNYPPNPQAGAGTLQDSCFAALPIVNPSLERPTSGIGVAPTNWTVCEWSPMFYPSEAGRTTHLLLTEINMF